MKWMWPKNKQEKKDICPLPYLLAEGTTGNKCVVNTTDLCFTLPQNISDARNHPHSIGV